MAGFKKPTTLARQAKVKIHEALGKAVPADTRRGYTDRMEFLSPSIVIAYKGRAAGVTYPPQAAKAAILAGANTAARALRKANDAFASITFLRAKESPLMTEVLDKHFNLVAGDLAGGYLAENVKDRKLSAKSFGKRDRRWVIEKIREKMLSLSFHLNTGVYLIDLDAANRDFRSGRTFNPAGADPHEEAYVTFEKAAADKTTWQPTGYKGMAKGMTCGFRNGEIHLAFDKHAQYTRIAYARIIIHEAAHKFLGAADHAYAHQATYPTLSLTQKLDNADSIAWAAISLYCGSTKMGAPTDYPNHWFSTSKP